MVNAGGLERPLGWWDCGLKGTGGGGGGGGGWRWFLEPVPTGSRRPDSVPRTSGGFRKEEGVWRGGGQLETEGGGHVRSRKRNQCGARGPLFQSEGGWGALDTEHCGR